MNISNQNSKKDFSVIYSWHHPKKFLNKYFLKDCNYKILHINKELIRGIKYFFVELRNDYWTLRDFYNELPKVFNIKNLTINFYATLFYALLKNKYSGSTFILGDISYPLYKSLLIASSKFKKIKIWIIYQGTGSIEKKVNLPYPNNVKKIFFPFSNSSFFEKELLRKAALENKGISFLNINSDLNVEISSNNRLAIFQGYNKKRKLLPIYIFTLVKILVQINFMKLMNNFDMILIFLHPRLKFLTFLNLLRLNKKVRYLVFDNNKKQSYKSIISYSPTINSSFKSSILRNKNLILDKGVNFSKKSIEENLLKLI